MTVKAIPKRDPEPSHAEIIRRIDAFALETRTAHAELKGAVNARFDAIEGEVGYIRGRVDTTASEMGALKAEVATLKAQPASAEREHDGGLPFKHGWRSWTAVAMLGVGILGGISTAFDKAGAFFLNVGHLFNTPPSH